MSVEAVTAFEIAMGEDTCTRIGGWWWQVGKGDLRAVIKCLERC